MIFKKLFKKRSVAKPEIELKKNNSGGKIIEFIGPSGAGKSTLYNATKNSLSSDWGNLKTLNKFQNDTADEQLATIHWKLFKYKFSNVDSLNTGSLAKLNLMEYFKKVLSDNLKLIQLEDEVGIFLEEGICHNFSSELLYLDKEELLKVLGNRRVVYLFPKDPKMVVNQIRKRASEGGHTVFHHNGLSDEALEELTKSTIVNFKEFLNHLEKYNIPVCQLYVEDGIEVNSKKIVGFEASFFSSKKLVPLP